LEFYGQSTTLVFDSDCLFCLTGADREALLDGKKLPLYAARFARAGEKLVLGKAVDGFRSYLSIRGGLFSLEIADESKDLQEGDTIGYSSLALPDDDIRFRRVFPDDWTDEPEIRAIPGPDMQLLSEEKMRNFFTTGYTVRILEENAPISLEGNWSFSTQKDEKGEEKESCCFTLPCGAICLEENRLLLFPAGERSQDQKEKKHPICLATVITADLPLLGQLSPGKRVHFRPVTVEAAQDLLKRRKKEYDRLSHKWNVSDLDSSEHQKGRSHKG
jgi:allophanate hydrolase subunit 2